MPANRGVGALRIPQQAPRVVQQDFTRLRQSHATGEAEE